MATRREQQATAKRAPFRESVRLARGRRSSTEVGSNLKVQGPCSSTPTGLNCSEVARRRDPSRLRASCAPVASRGRPPMVESTQPWDLWRARHADSCACGVFRTMWSRGVREVEQLHLDLVDAERTRLLANQYLTNARSRRRCLGASKRRMPGVVILRRSRIPDAREENIEPCERSRTTSCGRRIGSAIAFAIPSSGTAVMVRWCHSKGCHRRPVFRGGSSNLTIDRGLDNGVRPDGRATVPPIAPVVRLRIALAEHLGCPLGTSDALGRRNIR